MSDDLEKSFKTLKQAVPLMLKHKVSAEPPNYALWYTYASNQSPELNTAVDSALERFKTLSNAKTQSLYREHVADEQEVDSWQLRQTIEAMLIELSQSMKDSKLETNEFRKSMDKSLEGLQDIENQNFSVKDVMSVVRTMVKEGQKIRDNSIQYSNAIAEASKEIDTLKKQLEESQHQALQDALTGLHNRRYFDSELEVAIKNKSVSLILVDVDHFKKFNDTHGHQIGDLVLKAVAKKLMNACRDGAEAYRFGGEEFAIIVPNNNQGRACHLADNIRRAIEKIQVKKKNSGKIVGDITASFGVASFGDITTSAKLIETADKNLYDAKRLGRNRVLPIPNK